jgi:hypothetical protein
MDGWMDGLLGSVDLRIEVAGIVSSRVDIISNRFCHLRVGQHGVLFGMVVELNLNGGNRGILTFGGINALEGLLIDRGSRRGRLGGELIVKHGVLGHFEGEKGLGRVNHNDETVSKNDGVDDHEGVEERDDLGDDEEHGQTKS